MPEMARLLREVGNLIATDVQRSVQTPARTHRLTARAAVARSWTGPATLSRILMTVLVVAAAVALDLADAAASGRFPSLVLLVAPVAPLAGVAAAWSRRLDPAYDVVAATPRAGLDLVLRRTLAVLAIVIPALAAAGAVVGVSPARWLLPCLVFTAGALALGEFAGLHRAARGLAVAWTLAVVGPSLLANRVPVVLDLGARPVWLAVLVALGVLLAVRRRTYTRPADLR
jgi:hypothetical protein